MSITATERTQIVELTTLMFNAAPGATYLSQIVALYEANGHNLSTLAAQLAQTSVFASMNPSFQTSAEFAASFLSPLGLAGDAFAVNFVTSQLNAGASKAQVIYAAMQALNNLDPNASAQYQAAKAILNNKTAVAEYYSATLLGSATDLVTLQSVIGSVTADPATITSSEAALNNLVTTTFALTAGVDAINGTAGNDIVNGVTGGANPTFGALDSINGGTGTNTLNISDVGTGGTFTIPAGATIQNIQTFNVNSAESVGGTTVLPLPATLPVFDVSGISGLVNVNVTSIGSDNIKASATENVTVTDAGLGDGIATSGFAKVTGGNAVSITMNSGGPGLGGAVIADGTAGALTITQNTGGSIAVGAATAVKGAVTVTDTNLKANTITVDGGTNVSLTASTKTFTGTTGSITIGNTTKPTGTISVTENLNGQTGANLSGGTITVKGGTTVTVNETAVQPLNTASTVPGSVTANQVTTQSNVSVTGGAATTTVVVNQTAAVAEKDTKTALAGVTETDVLTFTGLGIGASATVNGLTFTNTSGAALNAAQEAAAFANLTAGAIAGTSTLGTYSGTFGAGWSTGAASGTTASSTLTATAAAAATSVSPTVVVSGTGVTAGAGTNGVTAVKAVAGVGGIATGTVSITDAAAGTGTGTINFVQLDGYNTATIASDALATLSLANSAAGVSVSDKGATTLGLTLNNVTSAINLDAAAAAGTYKTLNITTAGADSADAITAAAVTALNVAGTNAIDLTGSTFTALKTVTVSGGAGMTLDLTGLTHVTDVNASGTSGDVTVTALDATAATYEGGSGADTLTLSTANPTKAISLGAGNDSLTLALGTTAPTATIDGGAGTDTLVMDAGNAATASATTSFAAKVINFEHLTLTGATASTIDLAALGNYAFVTDATTAAQTLNNMASGGTIVQTVNGASDTVNVTNATLAANTSDSLNIVLKAAGAISTTVTAAGVESAAIAANDTTAKVAPGTNTDFLLLSDSSLTSATVTGNANLGLTLTSTKVSSVDASGMTGGLIYTTTGSVAETVKGGASANQLTAHAGTVADTLIGGASADMITSNAGLDTLTGGAGNDTFVITAPANVNSYATITDASAGDVIEFTNTAAPAAAETFSNAKVTLAATAVFQDYANAAVNAGGANGTNGYITWFQFGGDTYVVESRHDATATHDFQNGVDAIVKLVGLHDLSTASLNATTAGPALVQVNS